MGFLDIANDTTNGTGIIAVLGARFGEFLVQTKFLEMQPANWSILRDLSCFLPRDYIMLVICVPAYLDRDPQTHFSSVLRQSSENPLLHPAISHIDRLYVGTSRTGIAMKMTIQSRIVI